MSYIFYILSFLRVLRSAYKAQPHKLGFFMDAKQFELSIFTTLVSLVAVLGPFSYGVLALYEIGRLGYFNAPADFLQLGSFGFADVISKAYPSVIPLMMVVALAARFIWLRGIHLAYAAVHALGMISILLVYLVGTPSWRIFWAVLAFTIVLFCIFKGAPPLAELGNEPDQPAKLKETRDDKFWRITRRMPFIFLIVFMLGWMISAYGAKAAQLEVYYWCTKEEVVLGFYGDNALTTRLQNGNVGHTFAVRDIKTLSDLSYQKIGPLKVEPLWQPSKGQ